jgi:hypothetical protein
LGKFVGNRNNIKFTEHLEHELQGLSRDDARNAISDLRNALRILRILYAVTEQKLSESNLAKQPKTTPKTDERLGVATPQKEPTSSQLEPSNKRQPPIQPAPTLIHGRQTVFSILDTDTLPSEPVSGQAGNESTISKDDDSADPQEKIAEEKFSVGAVDTAINIIWPDIAKVGASQGQRELRNGRGWTSTIHKGKRY